MNWECFGMFNSKIACQYAIVRFEPYAETEEFANIGIVLFAPEQSYFNFKLTKVNSSRVTSFFSEFDKLKFKNIVSNYHKDLDYFKNLTKNNQKDTIQNSLIFKELVHSRSGIIKFSELRVKLSASPKDELNKLFDYYIERSFVKLKTHEKLLENQISTLFEEHSFRKKFSKSDIGSDIYKTSFPFVEKSKNEVIKVIKPFYLGHSTPQRIIEHSLQWTGKLNYLKDMLPPKVLFIVEPPSSITENNLPRNQLDERLDAFEQAKKLLEDTEIASVVNYENKKKILDYAK